MANTKMTKKDYFNQLFEIVNTYETDIQNKEDILQFLNHEIELLGRKSSQKRTTPNQTENVSIKKTIHEILSNSDSPLCIAEMQDGTQLAAYTNQRLSALLHQMIEAGEVERVMEKRRAYFKLTERD